MSDKQLSFLKDIPVSLSVELERAKIPIQELLQLQEGECIDIASVTTETLRIYANDLLIAHGELVLKENKFTVRITKILMQESGMKELVS